MMAVDPDKDWSTATAAARSWCPSDSGRY